MSICLYDGKSMEDKWINKMRKKLVNAFVSTFDNIQKIEREREREHLILIDLLIFHLFNRLTCFSLSAFLDKFVIFLLAFNNFSHISSVLAENDELYNKAI